MATTPSIEEFLKPLHINIDKVHILSQLFLSTFEALAAKSKNQFLSTPISESLLRPNGERREGR